MLTVLAAAIGTGAFSVLFGVPKQYRLLCALVGGVGWLAYSLIVEYTHDVSAAEATFWATALVVVISRLAAIGARCPSTIFLTTGIFPLVPGGGIYRTVYFLVRANLHAARQYGFASLGAVFAIVFAIVLVFELPDRLFHLLLPGSRPAFESKRRRKTKN